MARPRKPTVLLKLAGAFKKDPKRGRARAHEPVPAGPLGEPPSWFNDKERECWFWIAGKCAPGVLTSSDEPSLEVASHLRALLITRKADSKDRAQLKALYTEFGMTPASRSKVSVAPATQQDKPANEFAAV